MPVAKFDTELTQPIFGRVLIVGMGLIGGSIARAAKKRGIAAKVIAADASDAVRARVRELAIADEVMEDVAVAAASADLVIFCVPVGANAIVAKELGPHLRPGTIVSDVGSVKTEVVTAIAPHLPPGVALVPAHPVAGTEHSGPDAGFATLFINRWCILTPPPGTDAGAIAKVRAFWEAMGANVEDMTPEHHDLVLAITSHVPHLIAYNIVGTAADLEEVTRSEVIKFSAGGFRDFTRIAASDPTMWRDVFLNNKTAVLEMLGRFTEDLTALQRMIRRGDGDGLFDLFTRTRAIRRSIIEQGQETAAPDFGRQTPEK
ncbi:MAG: prephenate/arogenate dehydrogenase family protein [Beijerinckiaceae bacterium]